MFLVARPLAPDMSNQAQWCNLHNHHRWTRGKWKRNRCSDAHIQKCIAEKHSTSLPSSVTCASLAILPWLTTFANTGLLMRWQIETRSCVGIVAFFSRVNDTVQASIQAHLKWSDSVGQHQLHKTANTKNHVCKLGLSLALHLDQLNCYIDSMRSAARDSQHDGMTLMRNIVQSPQGREDYSSLSVVGPYAEPANLHLSSKCSAMRWASLWIPQCLAISSTAIASHVVVVITFLQDSLKG